MDIVITPIIACICIYDKNSIITTIRMKKLVAALLCFFAILLFFFRPYFFSHKLLFPSNLLVSFYTPWNTMKFPDWDQGVPFKGLGHDNLLIFYPMKQILLQAVREHSIPLWTPYNFSGAPYMGDGQSAVMYPLTWIYTLFPMADAFSFMVILVPFLTMLFTYGLLRHFKLSQSASIFGAITFAFSGFMSVWMEENPAVSQSALWLPLLILLVDLLLTSPRRIWFFLFTSAVAIMMSSGFLQICIYELLFVAAFSLFRILQLRLTPEETWKRISIVTLGGFIGLLLVSPYLATTWESYQLSPREFAKIPEIRSIFLVQWSHIISLFNPDWLGNPGSYNYKNIGSYYDKILFIGVIPLLFALFKVFLKKNPLEKFLVITAGVTIFFGFSSPVTQWLFAQPIPILSSMLPSRIFYVSTFCLSLFTAFGFEHSRRNEFYEKLPSLLRSISVLYLSAIIVIELFLITALTEYNLPTFELGSVAHTIRQHIVISLTQSPDIQSIVLRNISVSIILTVGAIVLFLFSKRFSFARVLLPSIFIILTAVSAWYFSSKSYYFGERQFVYPDSPLLTELQSRTGLNRIAFADDLSRIKSGFNVPFGLYSPEGLNPVFAHRYGQLIKSPILHGTLTNDIPRISVDLDLKRSAKDATTSAMTKKLITLLSISTIVESKTGVWYETTYPNHKKVWENDYFRLWQNPDAYPRAFIVSNIEYISDPQQILNRMYDETVNLRTTAIVEEPLTIPSSVDPTINEQVVVIEKYRLNDVTMQVQTPTGGLLFLSDTYAPGWKALVDGTPTPVYRTNFIFRGVLIDAGTHTVTMYYQPQSLIYGIYGMGAGLALLIIMLSVLNLHVMGSRRNFHSEE